VRREFRLWLLGLALGGVGTAFVLIWPTFGFVVVVALLIVLMRQRPRTAGPAGFLLAFAVWWSGLNAMAAERCAAFDAQPNGSCTIFFTPADLALPVAMLLSGVTFTALTFLSSSPNRGRAAGRDT